MQSLRKRGRTLAELQNEVLDLQGYLDAVTSAFAPPSQVIELDLLVISDDEVAEERIPSRFVIRDFLEADDEALLVVLGDLGSGKTTFCKMLVASISDSNETLTQLRIPVVISLRHFDFPAVSFSKAIFESINKIARRRWDPQMFEYLESQGALLLIIDGLDQLQHKHVDFVLNEIFLYTLRSDAKVVLTSRPYIYERFAKFFDQVDRTTVASLQPLTQEQVEQYVGVSSNNPIAFARLVNSTYGVHELLQHPLMLDLFVRSMGERVDDISISPTRLYENAIRQGIMQSNHAESSEEVVDALSKVALEMYLLDRSSISLRELQPELRVLTQTILMRNRRDDSLEFAHKSLMEYLVARRIAHATIEEQFRLLSMRLLSREVASFLSNILEYDSIGTRRRGESENQIFNENVSLLLQLRASSVHQTSAKISIRKLQLNRIKCFDSLSIEFNTERPTASVIVGDNGHGKSTLLQQGSRI